MPLTVRQMERIGYLKPPRHATVFLGRESDPTSFWCPYCRNKIMEHQQNIVSIVPGAPPIGMPISVKCSNDNCRAIWHFVSMV